MQIRTRFAPSSTGELHFGNVRTALYSWLFSKRYHGSFILRIEDTDIQRSNKNFVKNIVKTLEWLGLLWDEGPYLQSERLSLYKEKINLMLDLGCAYKCYCSVDRLDKLRKYQIAQGQKPRYDRCCRRKHIKKIGHQEYVVRFKNPLSGKVIFLDQIRGKIEFDNSELDDLIIQRRNGIPTYNFCVIVDDLDMNITHIIRGEDHINNTPRQINMINALSDTVPQYAHVSLVVNNNRRNLSKRESDFSVLEYHKKGFLKESILNYLIRLGWSHGDQEIFSINEMKQLFSLNKLTKSSSAFNFEKLLWLNHYYLNHNPIDTSYIKNFTKHLTDQKIDFKNGPNLFDIIQILRQRCYTIEELAIQSRYFFQPVQDYNVDLIHKYLLNQYKNLLIIIYTKLSELNTWEIKNIMEVFKYISKKYIIPLKNLCMIIRIAITGSDESPSINKIAKIIGKKESLYRIQQFMNFVMKKI